jgi:hypothetical protein
MQHLRVAVRPSYVQDAGFLKVKTSFPIYHSLITPPQEQPRILKRQLSFIISDQLHFENQLAVLIL